MPTRSQLGPLPWQEHTERFNPVALVLSKVVKLSQGQLNDGLPGLPYEWKVLWKGRSSCRGQSAITQSLQESSTRSGSIFKVASMALVWGNTSYLEDRYQLQYFLFPNIFHSFQKWINLLDKKYYRPTHYRNLSVKKQSMLFRLKHRPHSW